MDIALYMRVLWRFRLLMAAGAVVGVVLALLSFARLELVDGRPQLTSREQEVWLSAATLFVTQEGFPWGRSILDEVVRVEGGDEDAYVPRFGDGGRYAGLAALYVELAKSDAVRRTVMAGAERDVTYLPEIVKSSDGASALPMIYMKGFGPTPRAAERIADRAALAFRAFLVREQERNRIPPGKRIAVTITASASPAILFEAPSVVRPIFVLLLVLMATTGLAFVLENLRPKPRPALHVRAGAAPEHASAAAQRSA